jgi:hypothetical protein
LRPPVVPDAELGVGKPVRHVVRIERSAASLERPRRNRGKWRACASSGKQRGFPQGFAACESAGRRV